MFRKLLTGGVALALAAVMIGLVGLSASGTASAAVNGISTSATTVNAGTNGTVITIDAAIGDSVQILATTGIINVSATSCTGGTCTIDAGATGTNNVTVSGNAGTTDTVSVTWDAPATGPASATITAIVTTSAKSLNITVRGNADTVTLRVLTAASTSTTACQGTTQNVVRSTTATIGNTTGFLCTLIVDSAGTRTNGQSVIYTSTEGTLSAAAATQTGSNVENSVTLVASGSSASGDTGTITASSGGKSGTAELKFGGDPASCTITTNPTTVAVGGSSVVSTDVKDEAAGPVPDAVTVAVQQTNPGSGANAAILNAAPTTSNGVAATSLIAAIPGAIALGSAAGPAGSVITCTGTVIATGTVVPPAGGGTSGAGGFTGTAPAAGSIGLLVTSEASDAAGLIAALGTAGCTVESLAVLEAGTWKVYINGAPAVVNANFPASLAATTPFFTRCA